MHFSAHNIYDIVQTANNSINFVAFPFLISTGDNSKFLHQHSRDWFSFAQIIPNQLMR